MVRVESAVTASVLAFNAEASLAGVIDAVREQTVLPGRLIVVDNGSTDGTGEYLRSLGEDSSLGFPVEVITLPGNLGVGAGHGVGWEAALRDEACELVWVLEHDCLPLPDCLESLLKAVNAEPELGAAATRLSRDLHEHESDRLLPADPPNTGFTFNSTLIKRTAIERCGSPRADLFCGQEDWEYGQALVQAGFTHQEVDAWAIHPTKGAHRYGERPSVFRSYYSIRNSVRVDLERRGVRALPAALKRLVGGSVLTLRKDRPLVPHLLARWVGIFDAAAGRLGERRYRFLQR